MIGVRPVAALLHMESFAKAFSVASFLLAIRLSATIFVNVRSVHATVPENCLVGKV